MFIKIAIVLFTFMAAIDITILATIMPKIIATLGDMELYPLMSSAFLMSFFIATPLFGIAADHIGCKKTAFTAMGFFLLGSLLCGCSFSMKQLIFSRLVQGIGAGGLVNVCFITIAKLYHSDSKRSLMQAVLSSVWAFASIVGPLAGAAIAELLSWRWVFFINIPIGLLSSFFLHSFQESHPKLDEKFDLKGAFLFVGGTLLTFIAALKFREVGVNTLNIALLSFGALFILIFIKRSLSITSPLIPLKLLKTAVIGACIAFGVISGACLTMSNTLISLYIQGALRQTMTSAGYVVTATSIGWTAGSFFCGFLLHRLGLRTVCLIAICVLTTGFVLLNRSPTTDPLSYFIVSNFIVGFGLGSIVNTTIVGVQGAANPKFIGRATSFLSLMRAGGSSAGAAAAGFLQLYYFSSSLSQFAGSTITQSTAQLLLKSPSKFLESSMSTLAQPEEFTFICQLFADSIKNVFIFPVILLLASIPLAFFLPNYKTTK
jgi:MFS family permease